MLFIINDLTVLPLRGNAPPSPKPSPGKDYPIPASSVPIAFIELPMFTYTIYYLPHAKYVGPPTFSDWTQK
jgi:hypothetical protein